MWVGCHFQRSVCSRVDCKEVRVGAGIWGWGGGRQLAKFRWENKRNWWLQFQLLPTAGGKWKDSISAVKIEPKNILLGYTSVSGEGEEIKDDLQTLIYESSWHLLAGINKWEWEKDKEARIIILTIFKIMIPARHSSGTIKYTTAYTNMRPLSPRSTKKIYLEQGWERKSLKSKKKKKRTKEILF